MIIDNWDYYTSFRTCDHHYIKCPTCGGGSLKFSETELVKEETLDSQKLRKRKSFKEWGIEYKITTYLCCSHEECNENVILSGLLSYEKPERNGKAKEYVTPFFFYPPIHLFPIPENCPYEVEEELKKAFALYWIDATSCANKIRTCIEHILIDQGVKGKKLSLHGRIGEYAKKYEKPLAEAQSLLVSKQAIVPKIAARELATLKRQVDSYSQKNKKHEEIAKALRAAKWIGNAGSHADEYEMDTEEVVVGLKLLQSIVNDLYSDEEFNLKATRDYINKTGRPSPFLY